MANNTTHVSVPIKGMNMDAHPLNLGEQGYDYALNAVIEDFSGNGFPTLQNESSNLPCTKFLQNFKVIGYVNVIEQERIIVFLVNTTTGLCQIGEIIRRADLDVELSDGDYTAGCSDCGDSYVPTTQGIEEKNLPSICQYNIIVSNACLKFSINNPIRAVYRIESCGLQVYFTDGLNPTRHIEFDYVDGEPSRPLLVRDKFKDIISFDEDNCNVPVYSNQIDCNKLAFDPIIDYPCIDLIDVVQGGDLKAGVYQFAIAYAEENGLKRTSYFPATNPIPIFERLQTFHTDYETGKAIALSINNITEESPHLYYNLAVIKTINNQTSFELVGTFPITQKTITYTGTEKSSIDLTESDIFERKVYYKNADYIASSNNYLFLASLQETDKLNVQRISNNVKLNWQTVAIPEAVYRNPRFVNKFRSYLRDEVYSFGLVLIFDNGEESIVGHIPGPSKEYFQDHYGINVDATIANNDVLEDDSCYDLPRNKRWQVYNTAQIVYSNPAVPITDSCDDNKCYQYGDFAYWESLEKYPNKPEIYGDLCGQPIRHHKFPDSLVTHIHDGLNTSKTFQESNIVFPLGVRIDHDSVVTAIHIAISEGVITGEQADKIKGYRIVRGNRVGNKSIIAKGLLYDVWNYVKESETFYYPNYPYNDLRPDPFLTEDIDNYDDHDDSEGADIPFRKTSRYTFHSPDTHFRQPTLGDELKLEALEYGKSEGYFNHAEEQAKQKLLSTMSYLMALAGGLAAMMVATNEVREMSYSARGVDISGMGLAAGFYGPSAAPPIPIPGTIATHGTIPYNNGTGIGIPLIPGYSSITGLTKRGTKEQWLAVTAPAMGTALDGPLGGVVGAFTGVQGLAYKFSLAMHETQIVTTMIKALIPKKNMGIQYNSIGKYNSYSNIANSGLKRRKIETYSYLKPEMASIDEKVTSLGSGLSTIRFNNWNRETSVYLKVDDTALTFATPTVIDNSRFNINHRGSSDADFSNYDGKRYIKNISSYYGSIKQFVPDQYSTLNNIEYIDTGHCIFLKDSEYSDCDLSMFGGDTFISRFALKRKHSYFLQTRFGHMDETDVKYSDLHNVAYPRFYYNTVAGLGEEINDGGIMGVLTGIITDPATFLGRPKSYLDAKTNKMFYQNGKIYLYNYGIPYFLVESDINTDMRHGENSVDKDFFPRQQDLDFWLQEKNVPPSEDNFYAYNFTYSKQNREHAYTKYAVDYEPNKGCTVNHPNRIIYSAGKNWLNYKANDFYDFPLSNGKLMGVDGIENDKVLVRSENTSSVFNAYVTIPTSADTIQIGTGGMFQTKPQEYSHTTLGHAGTQHQAILHTEFGHIWVDAKRGQIFSLTSQGLDEISRNGMKNWFKQNLPFQLIKDFPNLDIYDVDNNFKGIGVAMAFDKRFDRFLITKLDYKLTNQNVRYNSDTKQFYIINEDDTTTVVSLSDKKYFCNKSWTLSFNFGTKSWVSYHSYLPNYYMEGINWFASGLNDSVSTSWVHNSTNKTYQVFYGKLWPFSIRAISKGDISKNTLNSIEFGLDAIRYHNEYDSFYAPDITFNKAVISTQNQSTGNLVLHYQNKNNLNELIQYPKANVDNTEIRITNADGIWRVNQFYDIVNNRLSNMPLWLHNCANSNIEVNNRVMNYMMPDLDKRRIRGEYYRILLSNDIHSNYKLIFKHIVNKSVKSYR